MHFLKLFSVRQYKNSIISNFGGFPIKELLEEWKKKNYLKKTSKETMLD